ncbi:MAG: PAS domain S-box protein, partial [Desulfatirhabdiaceae bacterium]
VLVAAGWQDICAQFHRANPESLKRCRESDDYIKDHLVPGEACHYKCKNGLWDIGIPVITAGRHLATVFLGQFFYEGEIPERELFEKQGREFGFDIDSYLTALSCVRVFSHKQVDDIVQYNRILAGFLTDLSEHAMSKLMADEALHDKEALYRSILQTAIDGFILADSHGRLLEVNQAYCRMTGYTQEELLTMQISDLDVSEPPNEVERHIEKVILHEEDRFETRHRGKDGRCIDVDVSVQYRVSGGGEGHFVCFLRDITDRKQAENALKEREERFRTFFQGSRDAIFITAPDARFSYVNPAACTLTGYSEEELLSMGIPDLHEIEDLHAFNRFFNKIMAGEAITSEAAIHRKDGIKVLTEFSNTCISIGDKKFMHTVARDITDRKLAEDTLRERMKSGFD